jgi:hypothetical protein
MPQRISNNNDGCNDGSRRHDKTVSRIDSLRNFQDPRRRHFPIDREHVKKGY